MGSSPCRRIPLLGIAHPILRKHLQVLEVHQEVDVFEVLVGKKATFCLCYVIRKILDSLSSFVYVNEKFCNEKLILTYSILCWKVFPYFILPVSYV